MTNQKAIKIIRDLFDGINPVTGKDLPHDHVCLNKDVGKALNIALETLKKTAARENKVTPVSAGEKWTPELDKELKKLYTSNWTVKQLAERYNRTNGAIKSRLNKLGLV